MWDELKKILVPFVSSKLLQVLAGVFATLGLSTDSQYSLEQLITAVVLFVVGWIISQFTVKKALITQPPTKLITPK